MKLERKELIEALEAQLKVHLGNISYPPLAAGTGPHSCRTSYVLGEMANRDRVEKHLERARFPWVDQKS